MQPMRLCLLSSRQFEATFENVQCRKIGQMQLVWLCILPVMPFENTFEKTHWRKAKKCNLCDLASFHANNLTRHLNRHSGKKPKIQPMRIWKIEQMQLVWLRILPLMFFLNNMHFKPEVLLQLVWVAKANCWSELTWRAGLGCTESKTGSSSSCLLRLFNFNHKIFFSPF